MKRKKTYQARLTFLADRRLGIHLRKEVREAFGWKPGTKLWITPLSKKKLLIEVLE